MIGRMGKLLLLLYYLSDAQIFLGSYILVWEFARDQTRDLADISRRERR